MNSRTYWKIAEVVGKWSEEVTIFVVHEDSSPTHIFILGIQALGFGVHRHLDEFDLCGHDYALFDAYIKK